MNANDYKIFRSLEHNSAVFLREGTLRLIRLSEDTSKHSEYDMLLLAISEIQTSLELALKAYLISKKGIRFILDRKQQGLSDEDIEKEFQTNNLRVLEFEGLKNQLKGLQEIDFEKKVEYKQIDQYQLYRNRILHFCLSYDKTELANKKDDLLYYVIHIVMYLLYDHYRDQKPNEFFEDLLGYDFYDRLCKFPSFTKAMENMACRDGKEAWVCPICCNRTFSPEDRYCYCCNYEAHEWDVHWHDCNCCGRKDSVIYDFNAPYVNHPHVYEGMCLACEEHQAIFECPQCGSKYHFFMDYNPSNCTSNNCKKIKE